MKSAIVTKAGEPFLLEDRPVPEPGPGEVRVRVHACGVCHSDHFVKDGLWPGLELPRVPGHEVVGIVDEIGDTVTSFERGDRVGVGWHGGHDGVCDKCLGGDFILCDNARVTGIAFDGGYAEFMLAPAVALARVPDGMDFTEAAPLLCAGITTFNSLRNSDARTGDLVAIQGLGGLGHLGVQFARAMGFEVAAVSRGTNKEEFASKLGAHHYVDAGTGEVGEKLQELGGARVVLATAPDSKSISELVSGLDNNGTLLIVAAPFEPISVNPLDLISGRRRVQGWPSGTALDSTETLRFAKLHNVRPMVEKFPLADVDAAYEKMMKGEVRFRSVLEIAG